jgi:hypothetical protein
VLNGKKKEFGQNRVLDDDPSSCWNSDQGLPQWLEFEIGTEEERSSEAAWGLRQLHEMRLTFQGGFTGTRARILVSSGAKRKSLVWVLVGHAVFADASTEQVLPVGRTLSELEATDPTAHKAAVDAGIMPARPPSQVSSREETEAAPGGSGAPAEPASDAASAATAAAASGSAASGVGKDHACESVLCRRVRIEFVESSDFFGRITVYRVALLGKAPE